MGPCDPGGQVPHCPKRVTGEMTNHDKTHDMIAAFAKFFIDAPNLKFLRQMTICLIM